VTPPQGGGGHPLLLLPVKGLSGAKVRLAELLAADERRELVLAMLADVVDAARSAGLEPRVLSPDEVVLMSAEQLGAIALPEATGAHSLNAALAAAIESDAANDHGVLIVLPDVPLIRAADFTTMLEATDIGNGPTVELWADRAGTGTNAIGMRPARALALAFGEQSLARHRAAASATGIAARVRRTPRVGLDIDTPDDVHELLARDQGSTGTARLLRRIGVQDRPRRATAPGR
jgi:2-phospho-L-lactate guanylyltransferase